MKMQWTAIACPTLTLFAFVLYLSSPPRLALPRVYNSRRFRFQRHWPRKSLPYDKHWPSMLIICDTNDCTKNRPHPTSKKLFQCNMFKIFPKSKLHYFTSQLKVLIKARIQQQCSITWMKKIIQFLFKIFT